jgi:hypothetical protein
VDLGLDRLVAVAGQQQRRVEAGAGLWATLWLLVAAAAVPALVAGRALTRATGSPQPSLR